MTYPRTLRRTEGTHYHITGPELADAAAVAALLGLLKGVIEGLSEHVGKPIGDQLGRRLADLLHIEKSAPTPDGTSIEAVGAQVRDE